MIKRWVCIIGDSIFLMVSVRSLRSRMRWIREVWNSESHEMLLTESTDSAIGLKEIKAL